MVISTEKLEPVVSTDRISTAEDYYLQTFLHSLLPITAIILQPISKVILMQLAKKHLKSLLIS
mgnify:CR=1 FL=1